jgi:hypothetical protein
MAVECTLAMQEHVATTLAHDAAPSDFLVSVYRNTGLSVELRVPAAAN